MAIHAFKKVQYGYHGKNGVFSVIQNVPTVESTLVNHMWSKNKLHIYFKNFNYENLKEVYLWITN